MLGISRRIKFTVQSINWINDLLFNEFHVNCFTKLRNASDTFGSEENYIFLHGRNMQLLFLSTYHSKPQHAQWKGKLCDWNWENKYGISSFAEHSIHIEKKWQMSTPCDFKRVWFSNFNFILRKWQTYYCFITRETLKVVFFC